MLGVNGFGSEVYSLLCGPCAHQYRAAQSHLWAICGSVGPLSFRLQPALMNNTVGKRSLTPGHLLPFHKALIVTGMVTSPEGRGGNCGVSVF